MNKIYARIWSNAKQAWVVTSELAMSCGAPRLSANKTIIALSLSALFAQVAPVMAMDYYNEIISGSQILGNGDTATSSTIISGGRQLISAGGVAATTLVSRGTQTIYSGGSATSTTLNTGGLQNIDFGGSATFTTLNNGGIQTITSGGSATFTTLNNSGIQTISSGGSATFTTLNNGGIQTITSGGSATSTTLNNGGIQTISSGGSATSTVIAGGSQHIRGGGYASATTLLSGGKQIISVGGSAYDTTVCAGGIHEINSGGSSESATISSGGIISISAGGIADAIIISVGGIVNTNTSASVNGTNASGSFSISSGIASGILLENSGRLDVLSGGKASNTIVNSGGNLHVSRGGSVTSTTVNSGGYQHIYSNGSASATILNSGGLLIVNSGGLASGTTLNAGGVLSISNGGVASDITISAGGALQMNTSASVSGTNANGSYDVTSRSARNVILENTGRLDVLSDGNASNTIVNAGGTLNVSSGGILFDTTVLTDGGNLTGAAINSGTVQYNLSGASTQNVNLSGPGQLTKSGGGTLTLVGQLQQQQINLNAGQLVMANLQATTDVIAVAGTHLSMTNGTTFTGMIDPTDITIDGSSTWNVTANSLIDTLTHAGNINFQYGSTPKTLTITGLTGNGGTITLNSVLGDSSSPTDKVILNGGRASGKTYVAVVNQGGLGAPTTGNGIVVIDAINGATTDAGAFELKSAVMAGAYNYNLSRNDNQSWYLRSQENNYRDAMWDYAALTTQSMDYDRALAGTADTRRQYQSSVNSPFWGRIGAGELTHTGTGNLLAGEVPNSTGDYGFVQLGADVWQQNTSAANVRAGAYVAAGGMHNTVSNNNGQQVGVNRDTIYTGGLYLTAESTQGWRVDSLIQVSHHDLSASPQDGTSLSTKGTGWLASVEAGWTVPLRSAFTLEPQLQYTIQGINLNDSRDGVADMRWSGSQRQQVRAGVKLANQVAPATATNLAPLSWWVTPSIIQSFGGSSTMQAGVNGIQNSQVNFNTGKNGTGLSLDGGVNMHVRDNAALGVRGGYSHTLNGNSAGGYYGQISLNLSFH
jgi:autotransporter passenger strand-loop-strand repeat protein